MTLGEKIVQLRSSRKLSQEALAAALQVSRQSVSKWETDASIPELDKLIQLSDYFGISLDVLVRQEQTAQAAQPEASEEEVPPAQPVPVQKQPGTQRVVGYILLATGLMGCLLTVFSGIFLILGGFLLICSVLCLTVKKHAGLVIRWFSFLTAAALMSILCGRSLFVFHHGAAGGGTRVIDLLAIVMLCGLVGLTVCTIRTVCKNRKGTKPRSARRKYEISQQNRQKSP